MLNQVDVVKETRTYLGEAIALLQRLIQSRSIQGNELGAQRLVADFLCSLGLLVDLWEPSIEELRQNPLSCSERETFEGSPNVVAIWRGSSGGRSLILNSHIDVITVTDEEEWHHDPWAGEVCDGRVYGRGASDMLGGLVACCLAIRVLRLSGLTPSGDIIVESVVDEETGGAGTLAAITRGYRAEGAIIPEPTDLRVFAWQQGAMWFRVTVTGRAAHAGTRYKGVSAIEKAVLALRALGRLEEARNRALPASFSVDNPIPLPISVGVITGGTMPSVVPQTVVLEGRLGVGPGENPDSAKQDMGKALNELKTEDSWFAKEPVKLEWFGANWLPGSIQPDHPLLQTILSKAEEVLWKTPNIVLSPWATDGGLLSRMSVPTVVFGPGSSAVAHSRDEFVNVAHIQEAAIVIAKSALEWCRFA